MKIDRKAIAISVLLVLAIAASIRWYVLRQQGGTQEIASSGTVEITDARLGFTSPGRIEAMLVDEGDAVTLGRILARQESTEAASQVELAGAKVSEAEAQLSRLVAGARKEEIGQARATLRSVESELSKAQADYDRASALYKEEVISSSKLDEARTALDVLKEKRKAAAQSLALLKSGTRVEDIEAARQRVEQARAALAAANENLDNTSIKAPFDGVVMSKYSEPGEIVAAGVPVLVVGDISKPWVRIYIKEDKLGMVRLGQKAEVRVDSFPGKTYQGTVTNIANEAEFTPKNVQTHEDRVKLVFAVKVSVENSDGGLKPGMPADVHLIK